MRADGGQKPDEGTPVVLILEDDGSDAERYVEWLGDRWPAVTATDVDEGVDALDDEPVVVLVDRRLPGGERVPERLDGRGAGSRVAVVSADDPAAVAPDFDEVLVEPVTRESLIETVEVLSLLVRYDELFEEYYALASERAEQGDGIGGELGDRLSTVRESIDEVVGELTARDVDLCTALSDREVP